MIFYFEMDFQSFQDKEDLEYKIGILLQNHREGKIFLILDREKVKWISNNLSLNSKNKAMLEKIYANIAITNSILEKSSIKTKIVDNYEKKIEENGCLTIGIKNDFFISVIDSPILVVENCLSDGFFIQTILNNIKDRSISQSCINISLVSGNGSQVSDHAELYIKQGRIVAKMKDADVISPLSSIKNFFIEGFCYNFTLPCHEIENTFCEEIIEIVSEKNDESNKTLDMLKKMKRFEENNADRFFLFFDLKKGISKEKFDSLSNGPEKKWLFDKISKICDVNSDFQYNGFGENIWKSVKNNPSAMRIFVRNIKSDVWLNFFFDFFQKVKWIFIASSRLRT
ncbi:MULTISPECIES: hypothetical protein [Acetobacter]|nr:MULTISPECIES: hypothetical protein [Acetobacter]